jgi:hypothetical protein
MKAEDIRGDHSAWRSYLNGPSDHAALLSVPDIGPARAALILRVYGSIDAFLAATPDDVAARSSRLVGPRLARRLQQACLEARIRTDWEAVAALSEALEVPPPSPGHRWLQTTRAFMDRIRGAWDRQRQRLTRSLPLGLRQG